MTDPTTPEAAALPDIETIMALACDFASAHYLFERFGGQGYGDVRDAAREALRSALARSLPVADEARWQPIETAPKDGTSIMGYWLGGKHDCAIHPTKFHNGRWWEPNEDYPQCPPTHWMPLLQAPGAAPQPARVDKRIEANWREHADVLVDIYLDGVNHAPDERCYVDGALGAAMERTRLALAAAGEQQS